MQTYFTHTVITPVFLIKRFSVSADFLNQLFLYKYHKETGLYFVFAVVFCTSASAGPLLLRVKG